MNNRQKGFSIVKVVHIGLTCSSEEMADRFYAGLLGLDKQAPKLVPAEVAGAVFNLASELKVINYTGPSVRFELFINSHQQNTYKPIDHVCLEIDDLEKLISNCHKMKVDVISVPKGTSQVTFIKDFDGNLFEVKEK